MKCEKCGTTREHVCFARASSECVCGGTVRRVIYADGHFPKEQFSCVSCGIGVSPLVRVRA